MGTVGGTRARYVDRALLRDRYHSERFILFLYLNSIDPAVQLELVPVRGSGPPPVSPQNLFPPRLKSLQPRSSPVQNSHFSPLPACIRRRYHRLFAGIKALEATSRVRISVSKMKPRRSCELCEGDAAVYCQPDSAFLCWACDSTVHGVWPTTCNDCRSLDAGRCIFVASSLSIRFICRSCKPDLAFSPSLTGSCLSSTVSMAAQTKQRERKPVR